jgi:phage terminase small subunit
MTPKQQRFVKEYLIDLNATQAAIRSGYSKRTANEQGARLLANASVKAAIDRGMKKIAERCDITAEKVLREISLVAFANMKTFTKWGPSGVEIMDSGGLTKDQSAAIAEVSETVTKEGGSKRVKLHDKLKALELLGKHLILFTDKLEVKDMTPTEVEEEVIVTRRSEVESPTDNAAGSVH